MQAAACWRSLRRPAARRERSTCLKIRLAVRHLTFHFDSVDEAFARLEQAGVEIKERPRFAVHSEMLNKIAFVRDPDGIIVELAERSQNRQG